MIRRVAPYDGRMDARAVVTPPYVAGPLRLLPFRALQLRPSRVGDPSSARLFARPYRQAGSRVKLWLSRGDLTRDLGPALYVHEYTDNGMTVRGVVGALDLSHRARDAHEAAVLPHEGIHPNQTALLARRLGQTRLQPAPILLTQQSPPEVRAILAELVAKPPEWAFDDRREQRHRIWAIRDDATVAELNRFWAPTRALIADGHHRYAAYLDSLDRDPGRAPTEALAMLVDQTATPLHLGAIHRSLSGTTLDALGDAARRLGLGWTTADRSEALAALQPGTIVASDGRRWARLSLPAAHGTTAVEFVHEQLLPALTPRPDRVNFHHSVEHTLRAIGSRRGTALLLPAPTVDQVWHVVSGNALLPEKATSFQPKPHTGVFIRQLDAAPSEPSRPRPR